MFIPNSQTILLHQDPENAAEPGKSLKTVFFSLEIDFWKL